jgi:hypothetical protein
MKNIRTVLCTLTTLAAVALAPMASAAPISESEPNNTLATAQLLTPPAPPASQYLVNATLQPDNPDYFAFDIGLGSALVTAKITAVSDLGTNDPALALFGPNGQFAEDDDGNGDLLPLIFAFQTVGAGRYTVLVDYSPFAQSNAPFGYALQIDVSSIPEPSTYALALVAIGLLGLRVIRPGRR